MTDSVEETISVQDIASVEAEPFSSDPIPPAGSRQGQEHDFVSSTTDNELETLDGFVAVGGSESEDVSNTGRVEQAREDIGLTAAETSETPQRPPAASSSGSADVSENDERPVILNQEKELTSWPAKWMVHHNIDRRVINLVYWKNWQTTGAVFGGLMFILLSLTCYTFISVVTSFSIALLAVAFLYRIGITVINAVQKTTSEHPYRHLMEEDLDLSEETVRKWAEECRKGINLRVRQLKRLFLIEDVVDSIKFGVVLWLLSYIGSWFGLVTITIIDCVLLFSLPKLYEDHQILLSCFLPIAFELPGIYKEQVDAFVILTKEKIKEICSKVQEKLPERLQFGKEKRE